MITNSGMKLAINRIAKAVPDYTIASRFKIGIDQATPAVSDTDLTLPVPISGTEEVCSCEATTNWNATTDGTIATSTAAYKIGNYSLTLIKAATTQNNVTWYNQTLTSLDFTSKDLWGWIYIKDAATLAKLHATTAVEVRYGNDYNTNYYKKVYTNANLAVGWNYIKFNTTTGTQVGTVTLASCDSLAIKLTFTATSGTLAAGDVVIDDFKLASSGDYFKDFTSGYPVIDETTFESTTESYLTSSEANGYLINGVGTYNTDGTILMQDVFKFTPISKSSSEEIIVEIKNRLMRR